MHIIPSGFLIRNNCLESSEQLGTSSEQLSWRVAVVKNKRPIIIIEVKTSMSKTI